MQLHWCESSLSGSFLEHGANLSVPFPGRDSSLFASSLGCVAVSPLTSAA